jgi:hypothetical protein
LPIAALLAGAPAQAALIPVLSYDLDNSLASSVGGPSLTLSGTASLGPTGVTFTNIGESHNGLVLADAATAIGSGTVYSAELYFQFSDVTPYDRVLNGNNADRGLYINAGKVNYYEAGPLFGSTFTANTLHHLVFARDGSGATIYLDGAQSLTIADYASSSLTGSLRFFIDDAFEEGSGSVDFIRLYDSKLSAGDVATLYNGGTPLGASALTGSVPEPASWAMLIAGFALAGGAMRRRAAALRLA